MISTAIYRGKISSVYDETKNLVDIYITNTKIIEKRSTSNEPCNKKQYNDDATWYDHAFAKLKCVPIFWNASLIRGKDNSTLLTCTKSDQYTQAEKYVDDISILTKQYDPPCRNLVTKSYFVVSNATSKGITNKIFDPMIPNKLILIRIRYKMRDFEEIVNKRSFTGWDLFGQAGGIIGLMLGFSFL